MWKPPYFVVRYPQLTALAAHTAYRLRSWLGLVALCTGLGWSAVVSASTTSTAVATADLLDVYAVARTGDPLVGMAEAQLGARREGVAQAQAQWWPTWGVTWGGNQATAALGLPSQQWGSNIYQPLWAPVKAHQGKAAQRLSEAGAERVQAAEQGLRLRVAVAYLGVLQAERALARAQLMQAVSDENVGHQQQRLDALKAKLAGDASAGNSPEWAAQALDLERARTGQALSKAQVQQAELALGEAQHALDELLPTAVSEWRPVFPRLRPLPDALRLPSLGVDTTQPMTVDDWSSLAEATHPELQALKRMADAQEAYVKAAGAERQPTVGIAFDSNRYRESVLVPQAGWQHQLALRVSVPVFSAGAIDSKVRQAQHQWQEAVQQLEVARRHVVREVRNQHHSLRTQQALMDTARTARDSGEQAVMCMRKAHEAGRKSFGDVVMVTMALVQAQAVWDSARHRAVQAWVQLLHAAGQLNEERLQALGQAMRAEAPPPAS